MLKEGMALAIEFMISGVPSLHFECKVLCLRCQRMQRPPRMIFLLYHKRELISINERKADEKASDGKLQN